MIVSMSSLTRAQLGRALSRDWEGELVGFGLGCWRDRNEAGNGLTGMLVSHNCQQGFFVLNRSQFTF